MGPERGLTAFFLVLVWAVAGASSSSLRNGAENSLGIDKEAERAVKDVEGLLRRDPGLPRLTRGEILSLIEEIREGRRGKDLLVVLPHTANSTAALEELYTKAPVTEMVHESAGSTRPPLVTTTKRPKRKRKPAKRPVYVPSTAKTTTSTTGAPTSTGTTLTEEAVRITPGERVRVGPPSVDLPGDLRDALRDMAISPVTEAPIFVTVRTEATRPTHSPTAGPGAEAAAEALDPSMQQLLVGFGLLPEREKTTREPLRPDLMVGPTVDPSSYMSFKPLPISRDPASEEMRSFLANFGLLSAGTRTRGGKVVHSPANVEVRPPPSAPLKELPEINMDILTPDMKEVLEDLGIMEADRRRRSKKAKHVFNPSDLSANFNKTEQLEKINKVLKRIRELSDNNETQILSQEELRELLLKEIGDEELVGRLGNGSVSTLLNRDQPDPLSLDELAGMLAGNKNEVKRQQPSTTTTVSSSTITSSTSPTSSTTTSSPSPTTISPSTTSDLAPGATDLAPAVEADSTEGSPTFEQLEESFGGAMTTTTPRPNGLYFLLDWNTFLDVGLEQRRVNLQFSPKVGDPELFLPVTVP